MVLISTADLNQLKSDLNTIFEDTSIGTTIKYRQFTGYSGTTAIFDVDTQSLGSSFTDWSGVSSIRGLITQEDLRNNSKIELATTKFVFAKSSVSGTLTASSDLIVESGTTYQIESINKDPLGLVYICFVRSM